MQHNLDRSDIPGVVMTHEFGGRRPPRGIRRRNRRLIAEARRGYKYPNLPKEQQERWQPAPAATTPTYQTSTTPARTPASSSLWGGGYGGSSPANLDPWVYAFDVERKAKGVRGDCPQCGDYGKHPLKNFRLSPEGTPVKLRQCSSCTAKFSDLPKPATPPNEPGYDELPDSIEKRWNYCPAQGCARIEVTTYVVMRDGRGQEVHVCKCSNGHLFKKGCRAPEPHRLWLERLQRT